MGITAELTRDDWVPMICRSFMDLESLNELYKMLGIIWELRKFEGVTTKCLDAARYRANQMCSDRGSTTVVDGESFLFAAGWACKDKVEQIPECVVGMLKNVWRETKPFHFIVSFDSDRRIKREKFPEFKSDRKPDATRDKIESAKPDVIEFVRSKNIQVEVWDGHEADDVLASVSLQCQLLGDTCVMVTEDKDCWQALGPNTTIYSRNKNAFYGLPWLKSTHKISPAQVVDWLVLVGKNGVKGADKIGEQTASEYLSAYGDFHEILLADITPKKREAMESLDYWKLREIHTLERTLPVGRNRYAYPSHDAV